MITLGALTAESDSVCTGVGIWLGMVPMLPVSVTTVSHQTQDQVHTTTIQGIRHQMTPLQSKDVLGMMTNQAHGTPALSTDDGKHPVPVVTPSVAAALAVESRKIREEFHARIQKMWVIPLHERFAKSR